jgi:hypothetical protein
MIFIDGNYSTNQGGSDVISFDLEELDWDEVNTRIREFVQWTQDNDKIIDFVEVWREFDDDEPLAYYDAAEVLEISDSTMKNCRSIWR